MITRILQGNFEKRFLEREKKWLQESSSATSTNKVFHVYIINM